MNEVLYTQQRGVIPYKKCDILKKYVVWRYLIIGWIKHFMLLLIARWLSPQSCLAIFKLRAIVAYKPVAYKKTCLMTFKDINLLYEDKVCSRKFPYFLIFPILKFPYCKKMSLKWKIKSEK